VCGGAARRYAHQGRVPKLVCGVLHIGMPGSCTPLATTASKSGGGGWQGVCDGRQRVGIWALSLVWEPACKLRAVPTHVTVPICGAAVAFAREVMELAWRRGIGVWWGECCATFLGVSCCTVLSHFIPPRPAPHLCRGVGCGLWPTIGLRLSLFL